MTGEPRTVPGQPAAPEGSRNSDDRLRREIRDFICEAFLPIQREIRLADTDELTQLGVLDSLNIAELVAEVQERSGIEIPDLDITEQHFGSIAAIAAYVCRRRAD